MYFKSCDVVTVLLCGVLLMASRVNAAETLYYPRPETENDRRTEYPVKLLQLAISRTSYPIELKPSKMVMHQKRALHEIEMKSGLVSIVWTMTSRQREQQLHPIRIPIYKGLIGWRLSLVGVGKVHQLSAVKKVGDLKAFIALQGSDWPDTDILRANGLPVEGSSDYRSLFKMLVRGRGDYLPRGLSEVSDEAADPDNQLLAIDPHIVLHYPTAVYFFVAKDNVILATALTEGLEAAIADGSFDQLFEQYFAAAIKRAGLKKRTIIELKNPLLPEETPVSRQALWFRP